MKRKIFALLGSLAVGVALIGAVAAIMLGMILTGGSMASGNPCTTDSNTVTPAMVKIVGDKIVIDGVRLDAIQQGYAKLIVNIAIGRGNGLRGAAVGVATSYQEAELKNIRYGDRDSLGLFQQRPSQNWGTPEQIMDPVYATNKFYSVLELVKGWGTMDMMEAAIEVQRPNRAAYEARWRWDIMATTLANRYAADAPKPGAEETEGGYAAGCEGVGGEISAEGWRLPFNGRYVITSPFNLTRFHPIDRVIKPHYGVDFGTPGGTPVLAANAGTVTMAEYDGGHGEFVLIKHAGGVETGYAHLRGYAPGIVRGVTVSSGQVIGYVGSTGKSTANHLHFETLEDGTYVDPIKFLAKLGISP